MPREKAVHFNPPGASGLTRCGRVLKDVQHSENPAHVDCANCLRLIAKDEKEKAG